jgi:hypothetical protein
MTKAVNDKYFTKPSTVDLCLSKMDLSSYDLIFEPSVGCGSFLHKLPKGKSSGADISPDIPNVVQLDFYNIQKVIELLDLQTNSKKKYLSIGNPPFGYMAQMAIDFFNGCALFSDSIAFILPRTFRKISVTNRLAMNFHLRQELLLPKDSFMVMDPSSPTLTSEYDVPCTFQIWDKSDVLRKKVQPKTESKHLEFVKDINKAKYAFRRVGGLAGDLYDTNSKDRSMSPPSHFYINCKPKIAKLLRNFKWGPESSKYDTAGNPSISKNELITRLEEVLKNKEE